MNQAIKNYENDDRWRELKLLNNDINIPCPHCEGYGVGINYHDKNSQEYEQASNEIIDTSGLELTCADCGKAFFVSSHPDERKAELARREQFQCYDCGDIYNNGESQFDSTGCQVCNYCFKKNNS
jgi:hypothetical protein